MGQVNQETWDESVAKLSPLPKFNQISEYRLQQENFVPDEHKKCRIGQPVFPEDRQVRFGSWSGADFFGAREYLSCGIRFVQIF